MGLVALFLSFSGFFAKGKGKAPYSLVSLRKRLKLTKSDGKHPSLAQE
jgi:hypothetical protein